MVSYSESVNGSKAAAGPTQGPAVSAADRPLDNSPHAPAFGLAYGPALMQAVLRTAPEDFLVHEQLNLPDDNGSEAAHLWVFIEKCERNTQDLAAVLAAALGCQLKDIGFAGLKDRRATTRQWFSLPGAAASALGEAVGETLEQQLQQRLPPDSNAQVLATEWRSRKLRRGAHAGNRFEITLRDVHSVVSHGELEARMAKRVATIRLNGFPNFYGPQRFGPGERNLSNARRLFDRAQSRSDSRSAKLPRPKGQRQRQERGMLLSAARSWLFNQVLAERVAMETWLQPLAGEPLMLAGTNSRFLPEVIDERIRQRLRDGDVSTSGPLAGYGDNGARAHCRELEATVLKGELVLARGLENAGVEAGRRALRAQARDLACEPLDESTWRISVTLDAGVYATSLLREIGTFQDARNVPANRTEV